MTSHYIKKLNHRTASTIFLDARLETPYKVSGRFVARGSGLSAWLASGLGLIDAQLLFLPVTACRWLELLVAWWLAEIINHMMIIRIVANKSYRSKICCRYVRWNDVCNSMFAFGWQWNTIIRKKNRWVDDHCANA